MVLSHNFLVFKIASLLPWDQRQTTFFLLFYHVVSPFFLPHAPYIIMLHGPGFYSVPALQVISINKPVTSANTDLGVIKEVSNLKS